ncbi:hypothetical protein THASP1DRAFT_28492 [Thamnocephalis sphaerospora]|uniref:Uncharacterized protein n=1 Tax=Thamnocephalis sphaerospora TaxID=78915 RepID=A0A4P9XUR8_9FUNG|nr:hypothetical protein THASP1DRAFT_28492 [Thamnocephalis sphaerospora]|eukprot:RKP09722.1 hypothetical protein THASP1DRAFT_28492 [Thamnocephalis sphaerospora]
MESEQTTGFMRRASAGGMLESATPDALSEERARQAGRSIASALKTSLNDVSLGMFRVCEHVQKRVPQIVEDKKAFRRLEERATTGNANMEDARKIVRTLSSMNTLHNVEVWLSQAIELSKVP